jgi:hypothetical protein
MDDELRPEYDLKRLKLREVGPKRKQFDAPTKPIETDVAEALPDSESIRESKNASRNGGISSTLHWMRHKMTITDVIPMINSLSHADKFKLMHFILEQLTREESVSPQIRVDKEADPLWDIVGMAEGEDSKVARNHDKYLYGAK